LEYIILSPSLQDRAVFLVLWFTVVSEGVSYTEDHVPDGDPLLYQQGPIHGIEQYSGRCTCPIRLQEQLIHLALICSIITRRLQTLATTDTYVNKHAVVNKILNKISSPNKDPMQLNCQIQFHIHPRHLSLIIYILFYLKSTIFKEDKKTSNRYFFHNNFA